MFTTVKKNRLVIGAVIACLLSLTAMVISLTAYDGNRKAADFVPPEFDENGAWGVPNVPEGLGWNEIDAQAYKASVCGVVIVENGKADIWFTNPESNAVWLKLRVLDAKGNILGETGLIRPGEYVQSVMLDTDPAIDENTIRLKIMSYEPDTYYSMGSAMLNVAVVWNDEVD